MGNFKLVAFIFIAAFLIRAGFVLKADIRPSSDAYVYDKLAVSVSQGKGFSDESGKPHSFYPPFYPFFLSMIYMIFGHSYKIAGIMQSIIGAFSCVLMYLIGKKIYSRASGIIVAFIAIVYYPFIKSAGMLLTEIFFTFLLLTIVFYLLKIQEEKASHNYIILGLLLGVAMLTKSVMLFFPIFIISAFIYLKGKYSLNTVLKKYLLVLLALSFPLMPWVVRNYIVYHKFVPTSAGGGFGLYSSYCPANGIFGLNAAPDDPVVIEGFKISSPTLRSKFFIKKTLDFIINNPKRVIILEVKKFVYFWAPFDWEIVGGRWFNFIYAALLPFFVLGLFLTSRMYKRFYPILAPIIYFQVMSLVFYGSPRFRLPIEPYIFIVSIVGLIELWKWARTRLQAA
ncbi:ArnT family glycosyltransferase [Candidatus Omnitrophota bacterium]